jgi:predicted TIM-barrel fold metal-dependent hydrolase
MMDRRTFLSGAAGMSLAHRLAGSAATPIIDTHVHLYDPKRPQGVPWPSKDRTSIYRTFLPADYRKLAAPAGITGMVAMECSPWVQDNNWVLDVAAGDTIVVGLIGNLHPGETAFRAHLGRLRKNPLFRGIRFGDLWGRKLADEVPKAEFIAGLKALADAGLALDTVGDASVLGDVVRITDKVPDLRVVIDHLPSVRPPKDEAGRASYDVALRELAQRPRVFVKISALFERIEGADGTARIPHDLAFYRPKLDAIYETFGPDRLLFGSNWTSSEPFGTFAETVGVLQEYFASKPPEAAAKYFWRNSVAVYRWVKRQADQPGV